MCQEFGMKWSIMPLQIHLIEKIKKREDITDRIEVEIADYLAKVSESDLTKETSYKIRGMLRIVTELERIADIIYLISTGWQRMQSQRSSFPEEVKKELEQLFDKVYDFLKMTNSNLEQQPEEISIRTIYDLEETINDLRSQLQQKHYERLEKGKYSVQLGIIFLDFVNSAERIGDHVVNINEALASVKNIETQ